MRVSLSTTSLRSDSRQLRWIVVAGCGHTGTTITAKVIGLHQDVYGIQSETQFLSRQKMHKVPKQIKAFEKQALKQNKQIICEKTPKHIGNISFARSVLSDVRFILCTRHPYDTIASLAARFSKVIDKSVLNKAFDRYERANLSLLAEANYPDVLIHRYEDFVTNPESSVRRICKHVGLEYQEQMLCTDSVKTKWFGVAGDEHASRFNLSDGDHESRRSWQVNQKIFDHRGKWKTLLLPDQVSYLNHLFQTPIHAWMLNQLNYNINS